MGKGRYVLSSQLQIDLLQNTTLNYPMLQVPSQSSKGSKEYLLPRNGCAVL